jgi:hypothetical protein
MSFDIYHIVICAFCASSRLRRLTIVEVLWEDEMTNEKCQMII